MINWDAKLGNNLKSEFWIFFVMHGVFFVPGSVLLLTRCVLCGFIIKNQICLICILLKYKYIYVFEKNTKKSQKSLKKSEDYVLFLKPENT